MIEKTQKCFTLGETTSAATLRKELGTEMLMLYCLSALLKGGVKMLAVWGELSLPSSSA